MQGGRCDFHTHTMLTDGELLPMETIRMAKVQGYRAIAITEHIGAEDPGPLLERLRLECQMGSEGFGISALWGVEITHVPPKFIPRVADRARKAGARIIVVHGETLAEPVAKGTNIAALNSDIDILAHPGLIDRREADIAAKRRIFLEITSRHGHSISNGHVARAGMASGAPLLINSDSHASKDMIGQETAARIGLGSGLRAPEVRRILVDNPKTLLKRFL
jgi:putative hydrolase